MKTQIIILQLFLMMNLSFGQAFEGKRQVISNPIYLGYGLDLSGTENIILVPENRSNPNSRLITVHYIKLDAKEKSNLPPIFYFRGGPGEATSPKDFYSYYTRSKRADAFAFEVTTVNQKRDVILVSQRGVGYARGLPLYQFKYQYYIGDKMTPHNIKKVGERQRKALSETLENYKKLGVDPSGYDIVNLIADIEEIRRYYEYDKIAMIGNSFGSQTALAYLQTYPNQVDRAILSAIEPLSHTYDSPKSVWSILKNIEKQALMDKNIQNDLPEIGLMEAIKVIVQRLEKEPKTIILDLPDGSDTVIIGIDDFRQMLFSPFSRGRRNKLETFPKYITELYNEDYRVLALAALEGRSGYETDDIMSIQMDNSLGISEKRRQEIEATEAFRWLGDINEKFTQTKDATSSPVVDDDFRTHQKITVPMILIHGNMDINTPLDNAHYLLNFLENGHLITVKNGTHGTKWNMFLENERIGSQILAFMNIDFDKQPFHDFKKSLPSSYAFKKLEFAPIQGKSLYELIFEED